MKLWLAIDFFIIAGLLHWVEKKATPVDIQKENKCGPHGCLTFYNAVYFIIVTISTVGYGDITMKSDWGRAVALCTMLAALLILPIQINNIMELASRRPYGGKFAVGKVVGSRFVIISGNLSYHTVQDFLLEFYHPSHDKVYFLVADMPAFPLRVVIMAPYKPSFEMKTLLANYKGRVEFIEGTPLKEPDLDRISAKVASAFFLMADRHALNPDAEDAAQFVRTLSVHRHCGSRVRVIVEMLKPENQDSAVLDDAENGIEIVCPEAIRFQLLAHSCHVKGLTTFLINLFKSGLVISTVGAERWMQQYSYGLKHEIFPVILPPCFHVEEMLFEEVAEVIYRKLHVILFGLDIMLENMSREVVLYPKGRQISSSDVGLVIAEDLSAAEEVSKFGRQVPCFCWKKICKLFSGGISNKKTGQKQDSELLEEVKKLRLPQIMVPLMKNEFSIRSDDCKGALRSGGCGNLVSSGHRSEYQSQIRKIISATHDKSKLGDSPSHKDISGGAKRVASLEAAIDIAMSWPPVQKWEKPDPPVLERRANDIMENLSNRTIHLRRPGLPNMQIVILHPNEPVVSDWGCVGMFEDVYFVKGSPLYELDLVRAGRCRDEETNDGIERSATTAASVDINNVLIAANVERLLHPTRDRIVVELQQESEIHYLRPKFHMNRKRFDPEIYARNPAADYMFSPPYIEGKGFSFSALNFLMYAKYFNRNTINIVEKLLSGEVSVLDTGCEQVFSQKLDQFPVPKSYAGRTFMELFLHMLRYEDTLVLGLHRPPGTFNIVEQ
eukprot:Gb_05212 [translate_table: standard]